MSEVAYGVALILLAAGAGCVLGMSVEQMSEPELACYCPCGEGAPLVPETEPASPWALEG